MEVPPAAFPGLALVGPETPASTLPKSAPVAESVHPNVAASAWPTSDIRAAPGAADAAEPDTAKPIDAAEPDTATELTPEELVAIKSALTRRVIRRDSGRAPVPATSEAPAGVEVAEILQAAVEAAPIMAVPGGTPEPVADARVETRRLLRRFRPHRDRGTAATPTGPAAEAIAVEGAAVAAPAEGTVEPVEPVVAAAAPEPAVAAAAPEPAAVAPSEPLPAAAPASPLTDVAVQPTWRMVAPDGAPQGEPQSATPAWATPERVTRREADAMPSAPWAARVATARPLESPVWAASSRNILAAGAPGAAGPVGIQSCVGCGLSLSANARFCRRCGTRQA